MPFNGSGTFVPTVAGVTPGGTASSTELNGIISDIVGGLTAAVAKSGESTMTGPLKTAVGSVGAPGIAMAGGPKHGLVLDQRGQVGICGQWRVAPHT